MLDLFRSVNDEQNTHKINEPFHLHFGSNRGVGIVVGNCMHLTRAFRYGKDSFVAILSVEGDTLATESTKIQ